MRETGTPSATTDTAPPGGLLRPSGAPRPPPGGAPPSRCGLLADKAVGGGASPAGAAAPARRWRPAPWPPWLRAPPAAVSFAARMAGRASPPPCLAGGSVGRRLGCCPGCLAALAVWLGATPAAAMFFPRPPWLHRAWPWRARQYERLFDYPEGMRCGDLHGTRHGGMQRCGDLHGTRHGGMHRKVCYSTRVRGGEGDGADQGPSEQMGQAQPPDSEHPRDNQGGGGAAAHLRPPGHHAICPAAAVRAAGHTPVGVTATAILKSGQ